MCVTLYLVGGTIVTIWYMMKLIDFLSRQLAQKLLVAAGGRDDYQSLPNVLMT